MDAREAATSMAMVRIAVGLVLLADQLVAGHLGLVGVLWGPHTVEGVSAAADYYPMPFVYEAFGPTTQTATGLWWAMVIGCVCLSLGLMARLAALTVLLASSQQALIFIAGDRGIDIALRAICLILVFSKSSATLSLDAYVWKGKWRSAELVPSWPRYFIILQLCWIYFSAGYHKRGDWWPWEGSAALWRILQDPHFARFDIRSFEALYPLAQLGTLGTMIFEISPPIFLLALYYRRYPHRAGRVGRFLEQVRFREMWIFLGLCLHVGLMVTMRLGIFPYGILALYPAFFHPDELRRLGRRLQQLRASVLRRAPGGVFARHH